MKPSSPSWIGWMLVLLSGLPALAMAGKNTPHDPKTFDGYSSAAHFELEQDLKYSERRGIGVLIEQGLRAGRYEARAQDKDGFYYFGNGLTVCQANPKCNEFTMGGGIWVSKKSADDIRIFLVQQALDEKTSVQAGVLGNYLANKDVGKIFIFPLNKKFAPELAARFSSQ